MSRLKKNVSHRPALGKSLEAAFSNLPHGLCLFGADEKLIMRNSRVNEIFQFADKDCEPGMAFDDFLSESLRKKLPKSVAENDMSNIIQRHRFCREENEGGNFTEIFSNNCILSYKYRRLADGSWMLIIDDVTEQHQDRKRMEQLALHDGLTNLPNRMNFIGQLGDKIANNIRSDIKTAVIGIDLDGFKEINDNYGHSGGDAVLSAVSDRLIETLVADECVARMGGDEFGAFKSFSDERELSNFLLRLKAALSTPVEFSEISIAMCASIGVAVHPLDGSSIDEVLNNADLAMYFAKKLSQGTVCHYESAMAAEMHRRTKRTSELRQAIWRDELSLVYQAQRSVCEGEVHGYEAYLRWNHFRDGPISPSEFIPLAEESGQIVDIGEWALRRACLEATQWPQSWRIAVNISAIQLMKGQLFRAVLKALNDTGIAAHRLELEISETVLGTNQVAMKELHRIKELGVKIVVDDFGIGNSSLSALHSFPFDKIKIDQSLLSKVNMNNSALTMIRNILSVGHNLGIPVVAEGLETEAQLRLLQVEGCDYAQGFLWGQPRPNRFLHKALGMRKTPMDRIDNRCYIASSPTGQ